MFRELGRKKEGAFVAFTVLGDPDFVTGGKILETLSENSDILELGLPFSDPIADGKRIQAADERALGSKMSVKKCFELIANLRAKNAQIPIGILVYYNLVFTNGSGKFLRKAKSSGVDGILVADMPIDEAAKFNSLCKKIGLEQIFIVAPTTGNKRMRRILSKCRGFAYAVGVLGVTGERKSVDNSTIGLVKRLRKTGISMPVCVGFGISRPKHAKKIIAAGANGVIVGSAIEAIIEQNLKGHKKMLRRIMEFTAKMRAACHAKP